MHSEADPGSANRADFEELLFETRDRIAVVTMNRPQVLNARNRKLRQELMRAFRVVEEDPDIWVAILTGAGDRAFSVGMDLKEAAAEEEDAIQSRYDYPKLSDALALDALSKPVIAAINGYALGGGLELALCCDVRIASEGAQLGLPEASRGMLPGSGGTQRLPRLVGPSKALEMMFTGERIPAAEAYRIGLVNQVVPAAELMRAAEALARKFLSGAPVALRLIKEAVRKGLDLSIAQGLALELDLSTLASQTDDSREGVLAFVEKREPVWRGR
jgi:enoyl-CoA hydratase